MSLYKGDCDRWRGRRTRRPRRNQFGGAFGAAQGGHKIARKDRLCGRAARQTTGNRRSLPSFKAISGRSNHRRTSAKTFLRDAARKGTRRSAPNNSRDRPRMPRMRTTGQNGTKACDWPRPMRGSRVRAAVAATPRAWLGPDRRERSTARAVSSVSRRARRRRSSSGPTAAAAPSAVIRERSVISPIPCIRVGRSRSTSARSICAAWSLLRRLGPHAFEQLRQQLGVLGIGTSEVFLLAMGRFTTRHGRAHARWLEEYF